MKRIKYVAAVGIWLVAFPAIVPSASTEPMLVKDINPGPNDSGPGWITDVNGTAFFAANGSLFPGPGTDVGRELWKSDGTLRGTVLVKDINPGASDSNPQWLANVNGMLYFSADDGINGQELWKSDGTESGTVMVKNSNPGSDSNPMFLVKFKDKLFFSADDGANGRELWKSDGTDAGTVMVRNISGSANSSSPGNLTSTKNTLYFTADSFSLLPLPGWDFGIELWKSDGTEAGTVMVKDINSNAGDSNPQWLTMFDGKLYFRADDGTNGEELWQSDGTDAGTIMLKDIFPGANSSAPSFLTTVNGALFFAADSLLLLPAPGRDFGVELWKSDGTEAGTVLVKDINPGAADSDPANLTDVNGTLFFRASDGTNGHELWKSDGTETGTVMVKNISSGDSTPQWLTNVNGTLFFTADSFSLFPLPGWDHGLELWMSDGTEAGTVMVKDINPGATDSRPLWLTKVSDWLFFGADDGSHGHELWAAFVPVPTGFADPQPLAVAADPTETWLHVHHDYSTLVSTYGPVTAGPSTVQVILPYDHWIGVFLYSFGTGQWEEAIWYLKVDW